MPNGIQRRGVEHKRLGSIFLLVAWLATVPLLETAQAAGTTAPGQPVTQQISLAQAKLQTVRDELFVNEKAQRVPNTAADKIARLKEREVRLKEAERSLVAHLQTLRDQQQAQEAQARRDQGRTQPQ